MRSPSARAPSENRGLSRREFVARGAVLGGTALLAGPLAACDHSQAPAVAVVGGGLAGLTCAYRLHQRGVEVAVYEAHPDRVGGRCWTARGFADGQIAEHGGEFIDSNHAQIRALVRELGLRLEDREAWAKIRSGRYSKLYFDGALRAEDEVFRNYAATQRRLRAVAKRTGYFRSYANRDARVFDGLSAGEWLDANVPGGAGSLLGQAMREYLAEEFGLDAARLTATDLLYLVEGPPAGGEPSETDPSDERYHVHGGNDQVPRLLAERLPDDALHLDAPLEALWRRGNGSYGLRLGGIRGDVAADQVVLAAPFTTLREVDLGRAGLSSLKRQCIEELGMGTNSKVLMQFRHRPAHFHRWDGNETTDQPFADTWDTSLTQPGHDGLITLYTGGAVGAGYQSRRPHGPAPPRVIRGSLAAIERAVPGISRDFNGRAWLDDWAADPWVHGSYAAFLPGQYTRFAGVIPRREGGVHFAGEHTSDAYQGFLEGAVASGERCAKEVLRARGSTA